MAHCYTICKMTRHNIRQKILLNKTFLKRRKEKKYAEWRNGEPTSRLRSAMNQHCKIYAICASQAHKVRGFLHVRGRRMKLLAWENGSKPIDLSLLRLTSFNHSSRATTRLQSRMFAVRSKMFQVQDRCIQGVRHWRRMTCFSLMYHRVCKYCTNMAVVVRQPRIRMTVITLCIGLTWVIASICMYIYTYVLEYYSSTDNILLLTDICQKCCACTAQLPT